VGEEEEEEEQPLLKIDQQQQGHHQQQPAVMFEIVQHVSFRMLFFGCCASRTSDGSRPALMMTCVCISSPVAILPMVDLIAMPTKQ
jgi:hypothetical protein